MGPANAGKQIHLVYIFNRAIHLLIMKVKLSKKAVFPFYLEMTMSLVKKRKLNDFEAE